MHVEKNSERFGHEIFYYSDVQHFLNDSRSETGIHTIGYGDGNLDLLVLNKSMKTTIIFFHAAMNRNNLILPVFAGLNLTRDLAANLIFVSDPSLEKDLGLAWFAGDQERLLQSDLPNVLQKILDNFEAKQNIIFFGPSGGGYAALFYSNFFPGSLAIPVNPQTNINNYNQKFVDAYLERCWGGVSIGEASFTHDTSDLYRSNSLTYVAYLQNVGDIAHIDDQLLPWVAKFKNADLDWFGLLLGHWGVGHQPAPPALLRNIFQHAITVEGDWRFFFKRVGLQNPPSVEKIVTTRDLYLENSKNKS